MKYEFIDKGERCNAKIKVIGIGGGGSAAINNMVAAKLKGIEFIAINTERQDLERSSCPNKLQIGASIIKGLGAGANPEIGRLSAEESINNIREAVTGADLVFITAAMGGGVGTGASPIIARESKNSGSLTIAVVTKPFEFEGKKRMKVALDGIEMLRKEVDTLIIIPNQRLLALGGKDMPFLELMKTADDVILYAVKGISDLITVPGFINLDFADIKRIMKKMGTAIMGTGRASGENRAIEAAQMAINSPLLEDISIKLAKGILINITGSTKMTMEEVMGGSSFIKKGVHSDAEIIWGMIFEDGMKDEIRITVIGTAIDKDHYDKLLRVRDLTPEEAKAPWTVRLIREGLDELDTPLSYRKIHEEAPEQSKDEGLDKEKKEFSKRYFLKYNLEYPTFLRRSMGEPILTNKEEIEIIDAEDAWQKGYSIFISTSDINDRSFKLKYFRNQVLLNGSNDEGVGFLNTLWRLSKDIDTVPDYSDSMMSFLKGKLTENRTINLYNYYSFISFACQIGSALEIGAIISQAPASNMYSNKEHHIAKIPSQIDHLIETVRLLSDDPLDNSYYDRLKIVKNQLIELETSVELDAQTPEVICFDYVIKRWLNLIHLALKISLSSLSFDLSSVAPIFMNRWNEIKLEIAGGPHGETFNLSITDTDDYISKVDDEPYIFKESGTFVTINVKPYVAGSIPINLQIDNVFFHINIIALMGNPFIVGVPIQSEEMFVGRKNTINRIIRGIVSSQPNNFLITGKRRIGKTSLLYAIKRKLPKGVLPVFISTEVCGINSISVCQALAAEVFKGLQNSDIIDHGNIPSPNISLDDPIRSIIEWFELLYKNYFLSSMYCMVFLIDEALAITKWDESVQSLFRYVFSNMNWIRGVLEGPLDIIERMPEDITSPLYNIFSAEKLGPISQKDASDLLIPTIKRLGIANIENVMDQIYDYTGGVPFYIQAIGYELIENYYSKNMLGKELLNKTLGQVRQKLETSYPAMLMKLSLEEKIAICSIVRKINPPDALALKLAKADFVEKQGEAWIIRPKIEREWVEEYMEKLLDDASTKIWARNGKNIDLGLLAKDLRRLRDKLTGSSEIDDALHTALLAAAEGNGVKVIKYLGKVGQWTLDTATKIGTDVAAAAIKATYGLD